MNGRSATGDMSALAVAFLVSGMFLVGFGCVFSPQTAGKAASGLPVQRVDIVARQWEFEPSEVRVKAGVPVELVVTSVDVDHGIEFTDLDVPIERVPAGRTVTVRFIPPGPGIYNFKCAVVCGLGHDQMQGILIVE